MTTREDFIKKYATADVDGRMEIILKNYSRFIQMVDGYEECLSMTLIMNINCVEGVRTDTQIFIFRLMVVLFL